MKPSGGFILNSLILKLKFYLVQCFSIKKRILLTGVQVVIGFGLAQVSNFRSFYRVIKLLLTAYTWHTPTYSLLVVCTGLFWKNIFRKDQIYFISTVSYLSLRVWQLEKLCILMPLYIIQWGLVALLLRLNLQIVVDAFS